MPGMQGSGMSETSSITESMDDSANLPPPTMLPVPASFEHFSSHASPIGSFAAFPPLSSGGLNLTMATTSTSVPSTSGVATAPSPAVSSEHNSSTTGGAPASRPQLPTSSCSPEDLSPRSTSPIINGHSAPGMHRTTLEVGPTPPPPTPRLSPSRQISCIYKPSGLQQYNTSVATFQVLTA